MSIAILECKCGDHVPEADWRWHRRKKDKIPTGRCKRCCEKERDRFKKNLKERAYYARNRAKIRERENAAAKIKRRDPTFKSTARYAKMTAYGREWLRRKRAAIKAAKITQDICTKE